MPSSIPFNPAPPHGNLGNLSNIINRLLESLSKWFGEDAPPLVFSSMSHRPGKSPGASPTETMYWNEDVLISLGLVVDSKAIRNAAT